MSLERKPSPKPWLALALCLAVLSGWALPGPALADGDPVMRVLDDRETVQGEVQVVGDLEVVRTLIRDPHATALAAGDEGMQLEDVGTEGPCRLVRWTIPHPIKTVSYIGRMCPTDDGATITLVESDDMAEYESTWEVVPAADGQLRLRCRVKSKPAFPLPTVVVRSQVKKALSTSLARIKATLERPDPR